MAVLKEIREFDISKADISLWVFRKSVASGKTPRFSGKWVQTSDALDDILRSIVRSELGGIEEVEEYTLLAQTNEGSVLSIPTLETHAGLLIEQAAAELADRRVKQVRELVNVPFYAIKFALPEGVLYAVSKTGLTWRTKKKAEIFFAEERLDIDDRQTFKLRDRSTFSFIQTLS